MKLADSSPYNRNGECNCMELAYLDNVPHPVMFWEWKAVRAAGVCSSTAPRVQRCPSAHKQPGGPSVLLSLPNCVLERKYWHLLCSRFDILFSEEMLSLVLFTL